MLIVCSPSEISCPVDFNDVCQLVFADIAARYQRLRGKNVEFLVGCTESSDYTNAILKSCNDPTLVYFERMRNLRKDAYDRLGISYTNFISTVGEQQTKNAEAFLYKMINPSYLSFEEFHGGYCEKCETFIVTNPEKSHCSTHQTTLIDKKEKMVLLDMEKIAKHTDVSKHINVYPKINASDYAKVIERMKKYPIARPRDIGTWIKKKENANLRAEKWFDIIIGYWTAHNKEWPIDILITTQKNRFIDNLMFPLLNISMELENPKRTIVSGNHTSKLIGYAQLIEGYGADSIRSYVITKKLVKDWDLDYMDFVTQYNQTLYELGGMVQRLSGMIHNYCSGVLPQGVKAKQYKWLNSTFIHDYIADMNAGCFLSVMKEAFKIIELIDLKIQEEKPWTLSAKGMKNELEMVSMIKGFLCGMRLFTTLLKPIIPETCNNIEYQLGYPTPRSWEYVEFLVKNDNTSGMSREIKADKELHSRKIRMYPKIEETIKKKDNSPKENPAKERMLKVLLRLCNNYVTDLIFNETTTDTNRLNSRIRQANYFLKNLNALKKIITSNNVYNNYMLSEKTCLKFCQAVDLTLLEYGKLVTKTDSNKYRITQEGVKKLIEEISIIKDEAELMLTQLTTKV